MAPETEAAPLLQKSSRRKKLSTLSFIGAPSITAPSPAPLPLRASSVNTAVLEETEEDDAEAGSVFEGDPKDGGDGGDGGWRSYYGRETRAMMWLAGPVAFNTLSRYAGRHREKEGGWVGWVGWGVGRERAGEREREKDRVDETETVPSRQFHGTGRLCFSPALAPP